MQKQEIQFKHDFIPEINQKSYQSRNHSIGTIVKITKNYMSKNPYWKSKA